MLPLLEHIGWALFNQRPGENRFTNSELIAATEEALDNVLSPPLPDLRQKTVPDNLDLRFHPRFLCDELIECGILAGAGVSHDEEGQFSFPHQNFLDFLAACYLARQADWQTHIQPHLIDLYWRQVIPLLVGRLPNPVPLMEQLIALVEEPDAGMPQPELLDLLVSCLTECSAEAMDDKALASIWSDITQAFDAVQRAKSEQEWQQLAARPALEIALHTAEVHYGRNSKASIARMLINKVYREDSVRNVRGQLIAAFDSPCSVVRWTALWAMTALGIPDCLGLVIQQLRGDNAPVVRALAARALVYLDHPKAMELLTRVLRNPNASDIAAAGAVVAIGRLRTLDALKLVIRYTRNPHPRVRSAAVHTLCEFTDTDTKFAKPDKLAQVFLQNLNDKEYPPIRSGAASGLGQLAQHRGNVLFRTDGTASRGYVSVSFSQIHDALVALLDDPTRDGCTSVRSSACWALCQMAKCKPNATPSETIALFRRLLNDTNEDPRVRRSATSALGTLRCFDATDDLLRGIDDDVVLKSCLWALLQFDSDLVERRLDDKLKQLANESTYSVYHKIANPKENLGSSLFLARQILNVENPPASLLIVTLSAVQTLAYSSALLSLDNRERQRLQEVAKLSLQFLDHDDANVRANALETFGIMAQLEIMGAKSLRVGMQRALRLLDGEDSLVYEKALFAFSVLAKLGLVDVVTMKALVTRTFELLDDENTVVKRKAVEALDVLGQHRALDVREGEPVSLEAIIEKITELLDDRNTRVQSSTLRLFETLMNLGVLDENVAQEIVGKVLDLLGHGDGKFRANTVGTLGVLAKYKMLNEEIAQVAVQKALKLLDDGDAGVKSSALITLEAFASLRPQNTQIMKEVARKIITLLDDKDVGVKKSALRTLEKFARYDLLDAQTVVEEAERFLHLTQHFEVGVRAASIGVFHEFAKLGLLSNQLIMKEAAKKMIVSLDD